MDGALRRFLAAGVAYFIDLTEVGELEPYAELLTQEAGSRRSYERFPIHRHSLRFCARAPFIGRGRLGHEGVTTLDHIQHWASRLKVISSLAKCLLGERCLEFFRFPGLSCVGQRDLYPFAILLRALPVERREELVRRAQNWPDPLAEQVARIDIKQSTIN